MSMYETVKKSITTRQAAERYGLQVSHSGMCKCPFHDDHHPSLKVDRRFHCFGCQADGDVISFTARLFSLSPREAAGKLARDFGLSVELDSQAPKKRKHPEVSTEEMLAHKAAFVYQELADTRNQLVQWREQYAPKSPDDLYDPRFLEAIHNLEHVEAQMDTLLSSDEADIRQVVEDYLQDKQIKEVHGMEPEVKTPVYHQSVDYAHRVGELEMFRKSHFANIDCKKDIEAAVASHFDGFRLDPKAIDGVMNKYGSERVSLVLAATVQVKSWDGRFSSANKDWAFKFDFPDTVNDLGFDRRDDYAVNSHPAILDGFINLVRREIKAREQQALDAKPEFVVAIPRKREISAQEAPKPEFVVAIPKKASAPKSHSPER